MKTVNFSEFRKNASTLLDEVESGVVITIVRHGRAVAEIAAPRPSEVKPAWNRPGLRLAVSGASLAQAILEERRTR
jgi:antitoxin (DNA-binding transcriptional repressor) of toxin-antitoxin stability system